jgi:hypothetical protein
MPDLASVSKHVVKIGVGATLRGVEATVSGRIARQDRQLILILSKTNERLVLSPLRKKVQWSERTGRSFSPAGPELAAYRRLEDGYMRAPGVIVTGPLSMGKAGSPVLQVRLATRVDRTE